MRRTAITLTAAAAILFIGSLAAQAAIVNGNPLATVTQNFTPIKPAACVGWGEVVSAGLCQALRPVPLLVPSLLLD
jgi:hypothetical protein